jgi:hypothetical protein
MTRYFMLEMQRFRVRLSPARSSAESMKAPVQRPSLAAEALL